VTDTKACWGGAVAAVELGFEVGVVDAPPHPAASTAAMRATVNLRLIRDLRHLPGLRIRAIDEPWLQLSSSIAGKAWQAETSEFGYINRR
jgi:hypothetical protein